MDPGRDVVKSVKLRPLGTAAQPARKWASIGCRDGLQRIGIRRIIRICADHVCRIRLGGREALVIQYLPLLNAILNSLSAAFLGTGFVMICLGKIHYHRFCMVSAFVVSTVFLGSYLTFHAVVGNVRYLGQGPLRTIYFAILISHTILAITTVPLVLRTLYLAVHNRFDDHRRWARWTLPIWFYVSVTGVVIYEMLY